MTSSPAMVDSTLAMADLVDPSPTMTDGQGYDNKMRKPSKGCNERDANYHRNDRTNDHLKLFFKVLIGDFHKRLVIPDKFVEHFGKKIEGTITLESRGGHTFDVQIVKNLGRTMFQSGWNSFVSAHYLNMGDFLVFKYDGLSRMKVDIFGPSGCEKIPPRVLGINAISGGRKREEPIDISSRSLSNSSGGMASSEDGEARSVPSYMLPKGTSLDNMQKKKLKERLQAICSEIPIFVCVMKKTNISGRCKEMVFSRKYCDIYLPFESRELILQCHGESWKVTCRIKVTTPKNKFKKLCNGWAQFARDNNLQLGDICLFELLKIKNRMNVHIIRKE